MVRPRGGALLCAPVGRLNALVYIYLLAVSRTQVGVKQVLKGIANQLVISLLSFREVFQVLVIHGSSNK